MKRSIYLVRHRESGKYLGSLLGGLLRPHVSSVKDATMYTNRAFALIDARKENEKGLGGFWYVEKR